MPVVDLDRYLQAVFAVLNASSNGRPSIFHFAHVLWRYRDTQLLSVPPAAIQRIVRCWLPSLSRENSRALLSAPRSR